jgi:hypothetical protein
LTYLTAFVVRAAAAMRLGCVLQLLGRFEEAVEQYELSAVLLNGHEPSEIADRRGIWLAAAQRRAGRSPRARAAIQRHRRLTAQRGRTPLRASIYE